MQYGNIQPLLIKSWLFLGKFWWAIWLFTGMGGFKNVQVLKVLIQTNYGWIWAQVNFVSTK